MSHLWSYHNYRYLWNIQLAFPDPIPVTLSPSFSINYCSTFFIYYALILWFYRMYLYILNIFQYFFYVKFFLFKRERESAQARGGSEKQTVHGARTWDLVPKFWDHDLSIRLTLNQLSHSSTPSVYFWTLHKIMLSVPFRPACFH